MPSHRFEPRVCSVARVATAGLTLTCLLLSGPALARLGRIQIAPVQAQAVVEMLPSGHRFEYCPGAPFIWEVLIENLGPSAETVQYDDDVQDGLNGNLFDLVCPPVLLPAGVDPIADVTCDTAGHTLQIRNILIPPCGRAIIRFQTGIGGSIIDQCNGGTVTDSTRASATTTPLTDQQPKDGNNTCVFVNPMCNLSTANNVKLEQVAVDDNGPPLLAGDTVSWSSAIDFRFIGGPALHSFWANSGPGRVLAPIPAELTFIDWITKPLEPPANIAEYLWNPTTRELSVQDPDPTTPPRVELPAGTRYDLGNWRASVNCDVPATVEICNWNLLNHTAGGYLISDNPLTYTLTDDPTCVRSVTPDFSTSSKLVYDTDRSGDAQPGEQLLFEVTTRNGATCPTELMDCECDARQVQVIDYVDTSKLIVTEILNDGTLIAPDQIEWILPALGASPRTGSVLTTYFRANVRAGVRDGDQICNTATITSPELVNIGEGGMSNCPTRPPTTVTLSPCMRVRIPAVALLALEKSVAPPLVAPTTGYLPGTRLTYTVTVTNAGGAPATAVDLWDCLDSAWAPFAVTPLDGGTLDSGAPPTGCTTGHWIRWPTIATLAAGGGTANVRFEVIVPIDAVDGSTIPNAAKANSPSVTKVVTSNAVNAPICSPALQFTKGLPQASYTEGDPITWTLTITNPSGCAASNLIITDTVDLTRIADAPVLTWTAPPVGLGGSSYDGAGTITWTIDDLQPGTDTVLTVTSILLTGTAPTTVCNVAELSWDQGLAPIESTPAADACATVETGCIAVPSVRQLLAHKSPTPDDVHLLWTGVPEASAGYRVCYVSGDKRALPTTCEAGTPGIVDPVPGCDLAVTSECVHVGAVAVTAGSRLYYQVKGVCGTSEGP